MLIIMVISNILTKELNISLILATLVLPIWYYM